MRNRFQTLSYLLDDFRAHEPFVQRLIMAGAIFIVVITIVAWRVMVPFILVVAAVAFFLRYSRPKDSL